MIKRLLAALLVLLMSVSLFACNNDGEEDTSGEINIPGEETSDGETNDGETGDEISTGDIVVDETKNPGEYQYVEKNDKIYVLAPGGALNLRTADYQKKTSVKNGTELQRTAVSTDGVWSRIAYEIDGEREDLYVNNKYITSLADLDAGFTKVEKTLISVGSLKIHIAPEKDEAWQSEIKIVGYYTADDEVKVIAENKTTGYYKVEFIAYGGATTVGYITNDASFFKAAEVDDSTDAETGTDASDESDTSEAGTASQGK